MKPNKLFGLNQADVDVSYRHLTLYYSTGGGQVHNEGASPYITLQGPMLLLLLLLLNRFSRV